VINPDLVRSREARLVDALSVVVRNAPIERVHLLGSSKILNVDSIFLSCSSWLPALPHLDQEKTI
jgi:hypothetical protein